MSLLIFKEQLTSISEDIYFDEGEFLREKTTDPDRLLGLIRYGDGLLRKENTSEEIYFLHGTLGNLYRIYGKPEKAILHLMKSLKLAESEKDIKKQTASLIRLGEAQKYSGKREGALELFNKAYTKAVHEGAAEYIDFALQHKGKCLLEMGQAENAMKCFSEALNIRLEKKEPSLIQSTRQAIQFSEKLIQTLKQ